MKSTAFGIVTLSFIITIIMAGCKHGSSSGSSKPATENSPFAMHDVRFTNPDIDEASAILDIGAKTARISAYGSLIWDVIEKEKGVYDWTASDKVLGAGYAAGANLFVVVGAQNRLEGTPLGTGTLPKHMDWYLQFLQNAVERYDGDGIDDAPGSPRIDVVQIENELDGIAFWQDTPENYALLLKKSYQAVKQAAPDMKVAIGGVATPAGFYRFYKPVLAELDRIKDNPGDQYFDIFDFHWSGQFLGDDDYAAISLPAGTYEMRAFASNIRSELDAIGYTSVPFYITEMSDYSDTPEGYTNHTEAYHAAAIMKRYIYALTAGIDKIFWAQIFEEHSAGGIVNGYFDHVGLINNPLNDGQSHKKLAYYTYKKMVEMLEGSEWKSIQIVQESGDAHIYKLTRNGRSVYVAWWDYLNDPAYTSGMTKQVEITEVQGSAAVITEAIPMFSSGEEVTDYTTAFRTETLGISNGTTTLNLGENPVFVELLQ
ncbi:MAG: hypothetical protein A2X56_15195 [Nitrospirae bacterium GWC2_57_13]|jgi:hypothetical protein|nr:MAG: hypothetical protein A2X56_15195 [Nitrospirae bacterium GWC2_57_13]HAS55299.1 hypothetical protein [Nitrospiraceae bacterium]